MYCKCEPVSARRVNRLGHEKSSCFHFEKKERKRRYKLTIMAISNDESPLPLEFLEFESSLNGGGGEGSG